MSLKQFGLIILALGFLVSVQAQKSKVLSAYNFEQAYYTSKKCSELAKAVEAIELGLTDEVASEWAKTWYYRGNIYFAAHASEDHECRQILTGIDGLNVAYESYMKAIKLDDKQRYVKDIEPKISVIASFYLQRGANHFNTKQYEAALSDFEKSVEVARYFKKTDTTALYNAALASDKLNNPAKAALYYEGLIDIGHRDAKVFRFLAQDYMALGDTAKAYQSIKSGRNAFPKNIDLIIDELNYYREHNNVQLALATVDEALALMAGNAELHFVKGTMLDNFGDLDGAQLSYEKVLLIDPNHINANYNLGALYYNKGVEKQNYAGSLPENQKTQYNEAKASADEFFQKALPYLEKANELDPHDRATLISLKNLYSRMSNDAGYKRVSNILDN